LAKLPALLQQLKLPPIRVPTLFFIDPAHRFPSMTKQFGQDR